MKLNVAPKDRAETSAGVTTSEFTIRASAKAFGILSDGLYSNKIQAIIRELSCNAVDSHVEAGNPDPFEVHLPSSVEPWFSVRDYGIGLDEAGVTQLYTTYFESTKTDSNDYIGALGLGSKSPFSYTDQFTVTAIRDGVQGIYTAFINENGIPSIAKLSECQTDQGNGVEVKFGVTDASDILSFQQEARGVFQYFRIQPRITGTAITLNKPDYAIQDVVPGVHVRKSNSGYHDRNTAIAIMGNIAYPINVKSLGENLPNHLSLLVEGCKLDIEFALGDIEFAASREDLSYTTHTVQGIIRRLEEIHSQLRPVFDARVSELPSNDWEFAYQIAELSKEPLFTGLVHEYIQNHPDLLVTDRSSSWRPGISVRSLTLSTRYLARRLNIELRAFSTSTYNKVARTITPDRNYGGSNNAGKVNTVWHLDGLSATVFVTDHKSRGFARARAHFAGKISTRAVVILRPLDPEKPMDVDGFRRLMRDPMRVMDVEDLDQNRQVRTPGASRPVLLHILTASRKTHNTVWGTINTAELNSKRKYVYLPMTDRRVKVNGVEMDGRRWIEMMNAWNPEGAEFCGVGKSNLDKVKRIRNMVSFQRYLKHLRGKLDDATLVQYTQTGQNTEAVYYSDKMVQALPADSKYVKLAAQLSGLNTKTNIGHSAAKTVCWILKASGDEDRIQQLETRVQRIANELSDAYPMLRYVPESRYSGIHSEDLTRAVEYVTMVDANTTKEK